MVWRPTGLANDLSTPEKPRERSDRATIVVAENTLQLDFSAADNQRRHIDDVGGTSGACVRAGHDRRAGDGRGGACRSRRIESVGISHCELWRRPRNDGQSATDKIVPNAGGKIAADDAVSGGVVVIFN